MTVVAEEDCTAIVIIAPSAMLDMGFEVTLLSICSSFPPDIFSRLEDSVCIPNIKKVRPPKSNMTENISIYDILY